MQESRNICDSMNLCHPKGSRANPPLLPQGWSWGLTPGLRYPLLALGVAHHSHPSKNASVTASLILTIKEANF